MTVVRRAGTADVAALTPLFEAYRQFYGKEAAPQQAAAFLEQRIAREESVIFVAVTGEQLTGFVQLYPLFSSTRMQRLWLLNDLYVDAVFRGQGIAVQLIDRAKQLCTETGSAGMLLETAKTNEIGNQLYPRTGFIRDEEHHYYYWDVP